ncbi:MAG: hypothetical protein Q8J90_01360, partial [Gallionella sp.]|nr:hypothetical protein [Gallionella sp.]
LDHIHDIEAVKQILNKTFWNHASTTLTSRSILKDFRHAGLDPASSCLISWIPAFAGMTKPDLLG